MDRLPASQLLRRALDLPGVPALLAALDGGPPAHLVGGAVRDLLLEGVPRDLDVVVEGPVGPLVTRLGGDARAHEQFGTATVTLAGRRCDLARARRERYGRPGALPEVAPAGIDEDLERRDFTVNAIALGLTGDRAGELTAAPSAFSDLRARELRVLHDRSFIDDPTRLLRLARYGTRLGFRGEPGTLALGAEAVSAGALNTVSGARVGAELRLLLSEDDPVAALSALHPLGLDAGLEPGFGLTGPQPARGALGLLGDRGDRGALAVAVASLGVDRSQRRVLLDRLAFTTTRRELIITVTERAPAIAAGLRSAGRPSEIAAAVAGAPLEAVALAGALGPSAAAARWISALHEIRLQIGGADLIGAGVPAGPRIGIGLRAALAAKLDGRADGRAAELEEALRAAG